MRSRAPSALRALASGAFGTSSAGRATGLRALIVVALIAPGIMGTPQATAAIFADDDARKAIIELRGRVELQARENATRLADLAARIDALNERIERRLERIEQTARGQLELNNQIEQLRAEVARLRGQLEVQTNELAQAQRRQRDLFGELDARIKPMEPVSQQVDGRNVMVEADERRSFEGALNAFRNGDFATAIAGFSLLRARWPNSAYGPAALYWIASAQFAQKDYKSALATHQQFLARHADNPRAPDAMLSVALSQIETGDKRAARRSLEQLIEKHPESQAATQASERLKTLR